ncbi:unnamed protein product [Leptidea sinapis]|uniref:Uncharacterized protein n=1 Tax=Leptidea sinapis TaxID=189913 RepID=A0A5E4QAP4_9NEOP|nr:unnamed protein product [Leptidea sinapis]
MLIVAVLTNIFIYIAGAEIKESKPYVVFPVPLNLPYRNERAKQCWLRIEDIEIVDTVSIYCYIAEAFLRNHIYDYNTRKMAEDDVDVSLWIEEPRPQEYNVPKVTETKGVIDWKFTTILDPITRMRLYVSRKADCKLIMYSRDAETSYKVECEKILYEINYRTTVNDASCNYWWRLSAIISIVVLLIN